MRTRFPFLIVCVLLVGFASGSQRAWAWGQEGHSIIAELAQRHLAPPVLAAVQDLLGGDISLASEASWADDYKFTPEGKVTKRWHYVDIDISRTDYSAASDCQETTDEGDCIVKAIPLEIAKLKDKSLSRDERRKALLMLVHLVGDLEQPLHTSWRSDVSSYGS
jgi:hypothetical protein